MHSFLSRLHLLSAIQTMNNLLILQYIWVHLPDCVFMLFIFKWINQLGLVVRLELRKLLIFRARSLENHLLRSMPILRGTTLMKISAKRMNRLVKCLRRLLVHFDLRWWLCGPYSTGSSIVNFLFHYWFLWYIHIYLVSITCDTIVRTQTFKASSEVVLLVLLIFWMVEIIKSCLVLNCFKGIILIRL